MLRKEKRKVRRECGGGDEDWTASQEEGPVVQNTSNKRKRELKSESNEEIAVAENKSKPAQRTNSKNGDVAEARFVQELRCKGGAERNSFLDNHKKTAYGWKRITWRDPEPPMS